MANALHAKDIFLQALEKDSAGERQRYFDGACDDMALRRRVDALLAANDEPESYLDRPAVKFDPVETEDHLTPAARVVDSSEKPGTLIATYKLLQEIGQGGFGMVYMAEQQEPVRRQVALKIIKPGMDTREVIARFEAERQALALMDHPNIAKVLDAGATSSGRPYFVMELVKGVRLRSSAMEIDSLLGNGWNCL